MPMPTARADKKDLIWGLIADAPERFEEDSNDCPAENEFARIDGFIFWNVFSSPIELAWLQGAVPGAARLLDGAPSEEPGKEEFPVVEVFIPCARFPALDGFNPWVEFPVPAGIILWGAFCGVDSCPVASAPDTTQIPPG